MDDSVRATFWGINSNGEEKCVTLQLYNTMGHSKNLHVLVFLLIIVSALVYYAGSGRYMWSETVRVVLPSVAGSV